MRRCSDVEPEPLQLVQLDAEDEGGSHQGWMGEEGRRGRLPG